MDIGHCCRAKTHFKRIQCVLVSVTIAVRLLLGTVSTLSSSKLGYCDNINPTDILCLCPTYKYKTVYEVRRASSTPYCESVYLIQPNVSNIYSPYRKYSYEYMKSNFISVYSRTHVGYDVHEAKLKVIP